MAGLARGIDDVKIQTPSPQRHQNNRRVAPEGSTLQHLEALKTKRRLKAINSEVGSLSRDPTRDQPIPTLEHPK